MNFQYSFVNIKKTEVLNISMYVHCKILVIKYTLKVLSSEMDQAESRLIP
jgi:hypothetical protein